MSELYLVSTPIGNLSDITYRALEVLRSVDFVAAEDTRVAMKLLSYFEIQKPLVSYYEHNMHQRGEEIVARIAAGERCALTTDAGTPAISDPGSMLVAQCRDAGIPVYTVPGCCAAVSAYSLAGLTGGRFCFEGFVSVNNRSRREHLAGLQNERRTMIFYEAPHKLRSTLEDFAKTFGEDRGLLIARELTKLHEESFRTTLGEAIVRYTQTPPRGEFVLVVDGAPETTESGGAVTLEVAVAAAQAYIAGGISVRDAVKRAADESGIGKNQIYNAVVKNG